MSKEEIIEYCLTLKETYKDYPFPEDFETVTMKLCKNKIELWEELRKLEKISSKI